MLPQVMTVKLITTVKQYEVFDRDNFNVVPSTLVDENIVVSAHLDNKFKDKQK